MNVLIWFKRDLRIHDHPALSHAAGLGAVLPLYIVEPEYWGQPDTSARQWAFTAECLEDLRGQLATLGAPLLVRVGAAQAVLERLCRQHNITRIVSHQETGNAFSHARDRQIRAWARATGIIWQELPQSTVARGPDRADRAAFLAAPQLEPPSLNALPGLSPGLIPTARSLRLAEDKCPHRQRGGSAQALDLLESFLSHRGTGYSGAEANPLTAERACARLSPHLSYGSLSLRAVVQASRTRAAEHPGGGWGSALASFQARLEWRDQSLQKLEDRPELESRCAYPPAELLRRNRDTTRLNAWAQGETGLPFVDACLRYLAATGWLNFRARATVIACAAHHLWLDWRMAGAVLAQRFTDYEPGIHWPQVQQHSGTAQATAPRGYNPVKQGLAQDPSGVFTRRWIPELSAVPDAYLQSPWRWPGAATVLGRRYPEPMVDVATAGREAQHAFARIAERPPSRPRSAMVMLTEPELLRPRPPQRGQLSLDL